MRAIPVYHRAIHLPPGLETIVLLKGVGELARRHLVFPCGIAQ